MHPDHRRRPAGRGAGMPAQGCTAASPPLLSAQPGAGGQCAGPGFSPRRPEAGGRADRGRRLSSQALPAQRLLLQLDLEASLFGVALPTTCCSPLTRRPLHPGPASHILLKCPGMGIFCAGPGRGVGGKCQVELCVLSRSGCCCGGVAGGSNLGPGAVTWREVGQSPEATEEPRLGVILLTGRGSPCATQGASGASARGNVAGLSEAN